LGAQHYPTSQKQLGTMFYKQTYEEQTNGWLWNFELKTRELQNRAATR